MIATLLAIVLALDVSLDDAEALRRTAPSYLLTEQMTLKLPWGTELVLEGAREHLATARVAAVLEGVSADDLLSIAWHESRYTPTEQTYEGSGMWWPAYGADPIGRYAPHRWSCGVATPWPHPWKCEPWELELGGGYLTAARHLAVWLRERGGNRAAALAGYGGKAAGEFLWRAAWIARERARRPRSGLPNS